MIVSDYSLLEKGLKKSKNTVEGNLLVDDELRKIGDYLNKLYLDVYPGDSPVEESEIIEKNRAFFEEYLPLQDILVASVDELPHEVNPFDIVNISTDVEVSNAYPYIVANLFGRNIYGFNHINVKGNPTQLTYGTLAHEIVHTQANEWNNTVDSIYNIELLPIFTEFLISDYVGEEVLFNKLRKRFKNVYENIKTLPNEGVIIYGDTSITFSHQRMYLSSSLKALHLFDIYKNSSREDKIRILDMIEKVFLRKMSVEKFTKKMNVSLANSNDCELVKKYVR